MITRRTFLRSTAALGAATFASPSLLACAAPRQERSLGIALVGLGNYSRGQLGPALKETQHCHLAGIVTGSPEKIPVWQAEYDIPDANVYSYETYDAIADNPDIDILYVVLPNAMHAEYTIRAAQAGKHVICEKPMAINAAEAEAMIAACEEAGVRLSIGYRLHFEPHNLEAMRLGQEQVFGPLKLVETSFGFRLGNRSQWRLQRELAGGGALPDVGVYAIQAARYVTGEEPIAVTAQEYKTDPVKFAEVDETITWQLEFPSGAVANSATSYATRVERLFASAERGRFELGPAYGYGGIQGWTHEGPMDFPQVNQQALQMDDFAQCILDDRPSRVSGEEGLRDMRVIDAIYQSIATGGRVEIGA